jgi:flavin-dependent dehydrogenase
MPPRGLLLAGDAAGFVDPMTGDGLRCAAWR